jgi:membrane protein
MDTAALHRDNRGQCPETQSANTAMIPNTYHQRLQAWLWNREPASPGGRVLLHLARYAMALARDMVQGEISLRAMSLVYTTLLSLAPLLALAFSLLKALGLHESLEPILEHMLSPLGDQAPVIADHMIGFVDNMKVGVLGFLGVILLVYTSVSMITKVEEAFNFIWKIGRARAIGQRFSEYLVVLMIGPMLVVAALGLTASVRSNRLVMDLMTIEPFGGGILFLTKMVPYLLIIAVLTFIYAYIPNTRVSFRAAGVGGLFAGVVWQSASVAFASFVANTNYKAIYSGFAVVIVLLLWIYVGWLIIMVGCRLAFYVQNPRFLSGTTEPPPASRGAELLALRLMSLVGRRFQAGQPPLGFDELRCRLGVPDEHLEQVTALLLRRELLAELQPGRRLLPARDLDSYPVDELWLWSRGEIPAVPPGAADEQRALELLRALEQRAAAGGPAFGQWLREGAPQRADQSGADRAYNPQHSSGAASNAPVQAGESK